MIIQSSQPNTSKCETRRLPHCKVSNLQFEGQLNRPLIFPFGKRRDTEPCSWKGSHELVKWFKWLSREKNYFQIR